MSDRLRKSSGVGRAGATPSGSALGRDRLEALVRDRVAALRQRLERRAGLAGGLPAHFRRPIERPFTAAERDQVTILFGGLTWKHERLIQAALEACGYRCQPLPQPNLAACAAGKQYGNNGLCNPAYFTVGNLITFLQGLDAQGLSRQQIVDRYVFFTAGTCGPCRFGMYEAEYRLALRNAGFGGFRVLTFRQNDGVRASTGEPGFRFTLPLGLGALNAFDFADAVHDFAYSVRPYEAMAGATDRLVGEAIEILAEALRNREPIRLADRIPAALWRRLARRPAALRTVERLLNIYAYLYGRATAEALRACRARLAGVEVDRLRVKPVVKITGEFWAQTTEGDGNFNMFAFLEREGAHVIVDPIAAWVMYLLNQARAHLLHRRGLDAAPSDGLWCRLRGGQMAGLRLGKQLALLSLGEALYLHQYRRVRRALGGVPHPLANQRELARLAHPFYHHLSRGGEGHLEVGKNIYYTTRVGAHMVLSLKPFGCLPSTQSDGVQSSVVARFKDMIFLPIETAAEGELNAHSRVQMALVEARARAQAEFQRALGSTGRPLEDIRRYVDDHPALRDPFYRVPQRAGIAGVAANFVLHVGGLMSARGRWWGPCAVLPTPSTRPG